LITSAREHAISAFVAVPTSVSQERFADRLGIEHKSTVDWKDLSFSVTGTPMLVFVDKNKRAWKVMVGRLDPTAEEEALGAVRELTTPTSQLLREGHIAGSLGVKGRIGGFTDRDVSDISNIVDVREREEFAVAHRSAAVNIPLDELDVRAAYELDRNRIVAVDCSNITALTCGVVATNLSKAGFSVRQLDRGRYVESCEISRNPAK
jgi:rhodanese-related sulfurtransferase